MTRFVFLRHASALNVTGRCIGHTNVVLSPEGESALRDLVETERHATLPGTSTSNTTAPNTTAPNTTASSTTTSDTTAFDTTTGHTTTIISSDLNRAAQSAQVIATALGITFTTDARLREMSFGEWDGRLWNEIEETDPERYHEWMQQWMLIAPPAGETVNDLLVRAAEWLSDTLNQTALAKRTVIVVSHAGWIRAALCHLLNKPVAQMFNLRADYAHATTVSVEDGQAELICSNVKRLR